MADRISIKGFSFGDDSDNLANSRLQFIEFYHIPSDKTVSFKAFLTEFSDGYDSDWSDEDVMGRMDSISTFKRTKRSIMLGWDVPSSCIEEAILNLERVSLLLTMLYPDYEELDGGASRMKTSPLFKLRFMNLIQNVNSPGLTAKDGGLLGKVDGFIYEPDIEQGFFDSLQPETEANLVKFALPTNNVGELIFPQTIKLKCKFTVAHQHALGWKNKDPRIGFDKFPYSGPRANFDGPNRNNKVAPNFNDSSSAEDRKGQAVLRLLTNTLNKVIR